MNNHIQLVLKSSTTELSLNDRELGIYVVPQLDGLTGLPEIRTTSGVNSGYDGGWTSAQNYDARSITIRGVIANEDVATVERLRRQLVSLAGQGKNEELTLDLVTEAGNSYTLQVRTIALEMAMQRVLKQQEFMLQLRADDPLIYDNSEQTHEALIQVAKATGGFRIDFALPLAIDGGSEETIVSNEGLEEVPTITRMYGALHNPKIINHTTNQSMQITADLGYAQGEPINPRDAEGSTIAIDDAIEAPFNNVQLQGNTEQPAYTGKNLLMPKPATSNTRGITTTYNSTTGEVRISGTTTASYPWIIDCPINMPIGTYTISINKSLGVGFSARGYYSDSGYDDLGISSGQLTRTITTTRAYTRFVALPAYGTNVQVNTSFKLQVEASPTSSDFEPYVGGTASPNPDYPQTVKTTTGRQVVLIDNGVALNLEQGTIAGISGEPATANNRVRTADFIEAKELTDYKLDIRADYGDSDAIVFCYDSNKSYIERTTPAFTPSTGTFRTLEGTKFIKVAITKSGTAAIITPDNYSRAAIYTQGYSHEINLGKNLFDKNNANIMEGYFSAGGSYLGNGTDLTAGTNRIIYIECKPNTTYTITKPVQTTTSRNRFRIATSDHILVNNDTINDYWRDSDGTTNTVHTITTGNIAKYLYVYIGNATSATVVGGEIQAILDGIQIELGQATEYASYFNPIELCKLGTYQDYIYKDNGKWFVHKEVGKKTFDGTESWFQSGATTASAEVVALDPLPSKGISIPYTGREVSISDRFTYSNQNTKIGAFALYNQSGTMVSSLSLCFDRTKIADLASAKTWLGANKPSVYYVLATPTDTEITYEPLIEQLNNLQWGGTLKGTNNISVDSPNLEGILDLSYFTDRNPDRRDEIVIDSRLKTITLNGLDIYNLKTEGSEFLTLAPGENKLSLQSDINGDNGYAEISYKQGYLSI